MRRLLLLFICLITCLYSFGQGQGYKILYHLEYRNDSTSADTKEELTELLVSGEISLFRSCYAAQRDSIKYMPGSDFVGEPTIPISSNRYRIRKDSWGQRIDYYEEMDPISGEIWQYTEPEQGLIVQVADTTASYSYALVNIQEVPAFDINLRHFEQHEPMEKMEFYKKWKEFKANAVDRFVTASVISFSDPATEAHLRKLNTEGMKKQNNPIELYP